MKYTAWIGQWLENYVRPSVRVRTYERYKLIAERHIAEGVGGEELDALTPLVLQGFVAELLQSGNKKTGGGLSPNSDNGDISVIQSSLKTQHLLGLAKDYAAGAGPAALALAQEYGVRVEEGTLGGVRVYTLTPQTLAKEKADKVIFYIHGGGYILGHGISGIGEGVLMAGLEGYKVVCVDYRMAPEHPYPAAIDDAFRAYQALLKTTPAENVAVFGTSTGGAMTLILGVQAARAGTPMPGALIAGTPWADLTKTGDTYVTNDGVDNILGTYDGLIRTAAELYAGGADMKDPLLSPVYAEDSAIAKFPPTLLLSGTRDLFLSNTVRMHEKLLLADRHAELIVYEALSHAQYYLNPKAPETKTHYRLLGKFLERVLDD